MIDSEKGTAVQESVIGICLGKAPVLHLRHVFGWFFGFVCCEEKELTDVFIG